MQLLRNFALASSLAGALMLAGPASAQEEDSANEEDAIMAEMMAMFASEPLTEEQQARVPLAAEVVAKMMPPGSLGEVMGDMFDGFLGPIMQKATEPRTGDFAAQLGLESWELEMDDAAVAEAAAIIDPVRDERNALMANVMPKVMTDMMSAMEPTMREALSEVMAVHFETQELEDISAFFSTESGASFAKKSMTMSSDPRIIAATMESMPQMMASFENLEAQMEAATSDLPAPRGFLELTAAEQTRISELTGFSVEDLAERAQAASEDIDGSE